MRYTNNLKNRNNSNVIAISALQANMAHKAAGGI
jgi:hypothetical protein